MTSKIRTILGFFVLTLLTVALAVVSFTASKTTITDVQAFVKLDEANSKAYEIEGEMYKMAFHLARFALFRSQEDRNVVLSAADSVLENTKSLTSLMRPENVPVVRAALGHIEDLGDVLTSYTSDIINMSGRFDKELSPAQLALRKALSDFAVANVNFTDAEFARMTRQAQGEVIYLTENTISFVLSQDVSYLDSAEKNEKLLEEAMTYILGLKGTGALYDLVSLDTLEQAYAKFTKIEESIQKQGRGIYAQRLRMIELRDTVLKNSTDLRARSSQGATSKLDGVMTSAEDSSTQILILSTVAVLASILIALFNVTALSRVLSKMSIYAQRIAQGDFTYNAGIKEKGEIGQVVAGIQDISATLLAFQEKCRTTANDVSVGNLAAQVETQGLQGNFKELAETVNVVLGTFTNHIDSMSIGIFSATTEREVIYMNKMAKQMILEDNVLGSKCYDLFKAPCCADPSTCLGKSVLRSGSPMSGETPCYPKGQHIELSVRTIPLHDLNKKTSGYMEFLADITQIKQQTQAIQELSVQATEVAVRVAAAAEELSVQTEHIVEGSNFQRERIESTSAAMTEMNSSVMEVAAHAADTAQQSDSVRQKANEGIKITVDMASAMGDLTKASENLKRNMEKLDSLSEGIGNIINVISDIADQTNLLALNAAIEAARAGEAGRGFAVVADEVRKLAEKTMDATREVDESVRSIQESSRSNQLEVTRVVEQISSTASLAQSSESALQEIATVTSQNTEMIHLIASAAGEQTTVSNEISESMSAINEVVNKNAAVIEESASAIRDLAQQAQELQDFMSKVK